MPKRYDVVSHGGEYEKDGQTKVRWIRHGAIFEKDGKFSMKLDSVPIGGEGWFKLFEPSTPQASSRVNQGRATTPPADDYGDDIPF